MGCSPPEHEYIVLVPVDSEEKIEMNSLYQDKEQCINGWSYPSLIKVTSLSVQY